MRTAFIASLVFILFITVSSCRKDKYKPDEKIGIGGCMDENSPFFNSIAAYDDGSCQFLYITEYELVEYKDDEWDLLIGTNADVYLKVKRQTSSYWEFTSNSINNAGPSTAQIWTAPEQFQLLNETYQWELYDADSPPFDADDLMASGSFNPVTGGIGGAVISESSDGTTTVKIHFRLSQ